MLKTLDSAKLDNPFLTCVAACNEVGFIAILPLKVFSIGIDGCLLHVIYRDGTTSSLEYADPLELSNDYDGLRTRILALAARFNSMTWETARWSDSPTIVIFAATDITGLRIYPNESTKEDSCSVILETSTCRLAKNAPRAAAEKLREDILNKLFA